MASLQTSHFLFSSSSSSTICSSRRNISVPKPLKIRFPAPQRNLVHEIMFKDQFTNTDIPLKRNSPTTTIDEPFIDPTFTSNKAVAQLYAILEAVADRVEMHKNVGKQRDNWNKLFLNSINMITLTAATMVGVAASGGAGVPLLAFKLSSTLLFSAATGLLIIMNKIQPSQLAEEQRNATRLFRQLYSQIETTLALYDPTEMDVKDSMEKVLALDRAYPLPLLGKMIEKFPAKFEPAVWWSKGHHRDLKRKGTIVPNDKINNAWNEELEVEMREVIEVIRAKDSEDYTRLGNLALKINKILAISGPLLTGIAAAGSAFVGNGSWAAIVAVAAGALATTVNTFEHAGQIGMVVEMYRNCAGFFALLEESIESTLDETDLERREDGEMFEMKVALQLGRSLSELRDLSSIIDEFGSKLF